MIKIQVLTPEWTREIEADRVFLPGTLGEFEVLYDHAPVISTLEAGDIRWFEKPVGAVEQPQTLAVKGGVVRLKDNMMQICAVV